MIKNYIFYDNSERSAGPDPQAAGTPPKAGGPEASRAAGSPRVARSAPPAASPLAVPGDLGAGKPMNAEAGAVFRNFRPGVVIATKGGDAVSPAGSLFEEEVKAPYTHNGETTGSTITGDLETDKAADTVLKTANGEFNNKCEIDGELLKKKYVDTVTLEAVDAQYAKDYIKQYKEADKARWEEEKAADKEAYVSIYGSDTGYTEPEIYKTYTEPQDTDIVIPERKLYGFEKSIFSVSAGLAGPVFRVIIGPAMGRTLTPFMQQVGQGAILHLPAQIIIKLIEDGDTIYLYDYTDVASIEDNKLMVVPGSDASKLKLVTHKEFLNTVEAAHKKANVAAYEAEFDRVKGEFDALKKIVESTANNTDELKLNAFNANIGKVQACAFLINSFINEYAKGDKAIKEAKSKVTPLVNDFNEFVKKYADNLKPKK